MTGKHLTVWVVYGPPGCGKTRHSKIIRKFFGADKAEDMSAVLLYKRAEVTLTKAAAQAAKREYGEKGWVLKGDLLTMTTVLFATEPLRLMGNDQTLTVEWNGVHEHIYATTYSRYTPLDVEHPPASVDFNYVSFDAVAKILGADMVENGQKMDEDREALPTLDDAINDAMMKVAQVPKRHVPRVEQTFNTDQAGNRNPDKLVSRLYLHVKSSTLYRVTGFAYDATADEWSIQYQREHGTHPFDFTRTMSDFLGGSFVEVK